jgi:putative ABC transport system permease protein
VKRRREIAIRGALGAPAGMALRGVLSEGLLLSLLGVASGTAIAVALSKVIQGVLYGVRPTDPATLMLVAVLSLSVAAAAAYLPARRAARVNPVEVLRAD